MRQKLFGILLTLICFLAVGCGKKEKPQNVVTPPTTGVKVDMYINDGVIFYVTVGKKDCIPVELVIYEEGIYDLYTAYEACPPGKTCNMMLKYTKKETGTYDYDVLKIIQTSTNADDITLSMDNLAEYEIYTGSGQKLVVENGMTNPYLDELLEQINVDLNVCAEPDYMA